MPIDLNWYFWEDESQPQGGQPQPLQGASDPAPQPVAQQPPAQAQGGDTDDPAGDPPAPDLPAGQQPVGFESWKRGFMKLAIKGDPTEMLTNLQPVRDQPGLELPQRKFLDDNHDILKFRQNPLISAASAEVRKLIKQQLDRNSPAVSVMSNLYSVLSSMYTESPLLREVFLKLTGHHANKAEYHRKFLAGLLGAVQEGGGGSKHDLRYSEKEYSIPISTRFYGEFGNITLTDWALQKSDPEKYLSDAEQERLQDGSPEERQVLRRRIVVSSIADALKNRAFLIHVATADGNIYHLGWDASEGLMGGYREGKLVVRGKGPNDADAMYNDDGDLVSLVDIVVHYMKQTGQTDENGRPETRPVPFIERKDGRLYLTASLETMRDLANGLSGFFFQEDPFNGNPSDLRAITRAVPSLEEILLRNSGT